MDLAGLAIERLPRIRHGELPADFDALGLALAAPAVDLVGQLGLAAPGLGLGVMLFGRLALRSGLGGLRGQPLHHLTEPQAGALLEAHEGKARAVGL